MLSEIAGNVVKGALALCLGLVGFGTLFAGLIMAGANPALGLMSIALGAGILYAAQKLVS